MHRALALPLAGVSLAAAALSLATPATAYAATRPVPAHAAVSATPVLKVGARGSAVARLQALLGVRVTGVFTASTRASVIAFQKQAHLHADGVVGAKTWDALNRHAAAVAAAELHAKVAAFNRELATDSSTLNDLQTDGTISWDRMTASQRNAYTAAVAHSRASIAAARHALASARTGAGVAALQVWYGPAHQQISDLSQALNLGENWDYGYDDPNSTDWKSQLADIAHQLDIDAAGGVDVTAARAALARFPGDLQAVDAAARPKFEALATELSGPYSHAAFLGRYDAAVNVTRGPEYAKAIADSRILYDADNVAGAAYADASQLADAISARAATDDMTAYAELAAADPAGVSAVTMADLEAQFYVDHNSTESITVTDNAAQHTATIKVTDGGYSYDVIVAETAAVND